MEIITAQIDIPSSLSLAQNYMEMLIMVLREKARIKRMALKYSQTPTASKAPFSKSVLNKMRLMSSMPCSVGTGRRELIVSFKVACFILTLCPCLGKL